MDGLMWGEACSQEIEMPSREKPRSSCAARGFCVGLSGARDRNEICQGQGRFRSSHSLGWEELVELEGSLHQSLCPLVCGRLWLTPVQIPGN